MRDIGVEQFPESSGERRCPFLFRRHAGRRCGGKFGVSEGDKFTVAGIPHAPHDLPCEATFFAQIWIHFHIQHQRDCQIAKFIAASNSVQQVL